MNRFFASVLSVIFPASLLIAQAKHENLGENVNSKAGELTPRITADGKTLYFIRDDYSGNLYGENDSQDIYYSSLQSNGQWTTAVNAGRNFNKGRNNSIGAISVDQNTFIVRGVFDKDGKRTSTPGWSVIARTEEGFTMPKQLRIKNYEKYSAKGKTNNFCFGADGKVIIMSFSDEKDGGNSDLYIIRLNEAGEAEEGDKKKKFNLKKLKQSIGKLTGKENEWSEPELIKSISFKGIDEMSPFLSADMKTLYYSSDRGGGYGDNDVWKTTRLDDTWQNWSEPVNLGPEVNTKNWDAYYTIDARGEYAFMVSSANSFGRTDIVKIKLREEMRPQPVVLIKGRVFNAKTKQPMGAVITYENLVNGNNVGIANSNPANGEYQIALPYGVNYGFLGAAPKFISVSDNIDLTKTEQYKEITKDLYLVPLEVGSTIRLNNIFFDFGKATLREESFAELDRLTEILNENPAMEIELSGHTDNVGSDKDNQKLSEERINSVKNYLVKNSIDTKRLKAVGYGEAKPIASNETDEGRQINRRVEFTIVRN